MASQILSILGTGSASAATSSSGSLTLSHLPVSIPNVIPTNVSPTISAIGTISLPVPSIILLPSAPHITISSSSSTPTSSTSILLTSSSPTSIPTTSKTSTLSSITQIPSTSAPPFKSASSLASLTGTANIGFTTVVTVVSGTTVTSVLPTTLINSPSADVVSRRTATIAGATTGFVALFLIALGVVFWYRRHKLRKVLESTGKKREGRGLLDGEEFDDDERNLSTSTQPFQYPTHVFKPEASST